uniref:Phospholipid scramblase n=2 Tax=Amphora coffeiformis TaxID=265554 RepID=A0A7S3L062_9STRA
MVVKENNTEAELLSVERPCRCAAGGCKCCCYQEAAISSGGQRLGIIKEDCYFCVPSFTVKDSKLDGLYIIHPPTCLGGICINCCAEGNPCGKKGCCKASFRVYPYAQKGQTTDEAPYIGLILKKPKSMATEIFTDADAFDVTFPDNATVDEKAVLVGSTLLLNAVFFETDNSG